MFRKYAMKTGFAAAAALGLALTGAASAAQAAGPTIRLDRLAAHVIIIPEARANVDVVVRNFGRRGLGKPTLTVSGADMTISGDLSHGDLRNCRVRHGHGVGMGFFRHIGEEDLPVVTLHVPMDVTIEADSAVEVEVTGPLHSLKVSERGCGDWRIGDVGDRLEYDLQGRGDMQGGSAGSATLRLQGMGDLHLRATGALDVSLQGMGDVIVDQVNGPVHASLQGMGDLRIRGGHATQFTADLEGMGGIKFEGVADTVDASASGMGDIHVAKATGEVRKRQSGFSSVTVGR
jgi:hypothetical protein